MTGKQTRRLLAGVVTLSIAVGVCQAQPAEKSATEQAIEEELMRLSGTQTPHEKQEVDLTDATVNILPFEIPKEFEKTGEVYPDSVDITVKDGTYWRDGKPVFLIGVESSGYEGSWLCKTLGVDVQPVHNRVKAAYRAALKVTESQTPEGTVQLTVDCDSPDPYGDARIREILLGGTQTWLDFHLTMSSWYPLPYLEYRFHPPFYTPHLPGWRKCSSHFLDLNMDNPEAFEHYVNMIRWGNRYFRKYPLLHIELVNEVSYINPNPENIKAFQESMAEKYGSIEKANAVWGKEYESFQKVMPPVNISSSGLYNSEWGVIPHGDELSNALWVDWIEWMQDDAEGVFKALVDEFKTYNPDTPCTFQTPYYTGSHAQTPAMWNRVVDTYGQEHGLTLFKVEAGKEDWDEVRSMLSQALCSDIVAKALPDKPSLNQEPVCQGYPRGEYVIGPAGMRSFFWNQAVHGAGGSIISYYYSPATSAGGWSTFDPRRMKLTALKEMPRVRNEINSVGEIVLPRPRIKGRAAMLYSYESARPLRPEDDKGRFRRVIPEVCDIYGPALFTGVPLDVIDNDMLIHDNLSPYDVLVLGRACRVQPGTQDALYRYVGAGGVLVVTSDSLRVNHETHLPIDPFELVGGRVGEVVTSSEKVDFGKLGIAPCQTVPVYGTPIDGADDFSKPIYGFDFTPRDAQVLAATEDGAPALTVNEVGLGKVYYMAREFDGPTKCRLMKWIMDQAGQEPDVQAEMTDDLETNYVETHLFRGDSHHVVYAMNWGGGPREVLLRVLAEVPGESFLVRNLRTREYLGPDGGEGKAEWTRAQLEAGIPCELPMHDPTVFVVDEASAEPLPLKDLSDEHKEILQWLWRESPPADRAVLMDVVHNTEGRANGYKIPTAAKLMEDKGFHVEYLVRPLDKMQVRTAEKVRDGDLSQFNIYVLSGSRGNEDFSEEELAAIEQFVKDGGGLLFCMVRNWHGGVGAENDILDLFGMKTPFTYIYDPEHAMYDEPLWFKATDIAEHPIAKGVEELYVMGARPVVGEGEAIAFSGAGSYTYHPWGEPRKDGPACFIRAREYGKGRVVAVGSDYLFRPDDLDQSDNKKLLENIVDWLAEPTAGAPVAKRDFGELNALPPVPPAEPAENVIHHWDFESDPQFRGGTFVQGFAYTGNGCIQADKYDSQWHDSLVATEWSGDGFCTIPENPYLNFAYYSRYPCPTRILFETPETPAKYSTRLESGGWRFVSLPVSEFEQGDNLAGQPLANIMIKLGEAGIGMEVYIDDLSVSSGPVSPPRAE